MMKVNDFISKAKSIEAQDTTYKLGKFLNTKSGGKLLTDCSGLVKGILWGWDEENIPVYKSNGVPDINANTMIKQCSEVTTDFTKAKAGWLVWMDGHIGIYIGSGIVIESTPIWKDGVQRTFAKGSGYVNGNNLKSRQWTKCGKFDKYIDYTEEKSRMYQLVKACKVYKTASDAKNGKNYVGYYAMGIYYIFNESNGMINVTNKKGVAGGWINPADNKIQPIYYSKYTGKSTRIDEVFKAIGVPAEYRGLWTKRRAVAKKNGIPNYIGTALQNNRLIELARIGKLLRV